MYGAFIGDIVGSKYEFHNIKTKKFPLFSKDCDYTDDTNSDSGSGQGDSAKR